METLGPFKGIYMVTLGFYWGYIGIREKKMETTGIRGIGYDGFRV